MRACKYAMDQAKKQTKAYWNDKNGRNFDRLRPTWEHTMQFKLSLKHAT